MEPPLDLVLVALSIPMCDKTPHVAQTIDRGIAMLTREELESRVRELEGEANKRWSWAMSQVRAHPKTAVAVSLAVGALFDRVLLPIAIAAIGLAT